jgi:hypothetical protein
VPDLLALIETSAPAGTAAGLYTLFSPYFGGSAFTCCSFIGYAANLSLKDISFPYFAPETFALIGSR